MYAYVPRIAEIHVKEPPPSFSPTYNCSTREDIGGVPHDTTPFPRANNSVATNHWTKKRFWFTKRGLLAEWGRSWATQKSFRGAPSGDSRNFSPVRKVVTTSLPRYLTSKYLLAAVKFPPPVSNEIALTATRELLFYKTRTVSATPSCETSSSVIDSSTTFTYDNNNTGVTSFNVYHCERCRDKI